MAARDPIRDHYFEASLFRARALCAALASAALVLLLLGRLYYLQGVSHGHYATLSTSNRVRLMAVAPSRGLVFDRNGVLLAENMPSYRLEITPEAVPDMDTTLAALREFVQFSDDDLLRFRKALRRKRPFEGVPLRTNLSDDEVARVAANRHRFPGVDIAARLAREYPLGDLMTHVLGYVGRIDEREIRELDPRNYSGTSYVGKVGVEKYYEDLLHGTVGYQQVEVNAEGRLLRILEETPPVSGHDIYLTLDVRLQAAARDALEEHSGALVAIDPRNGDVLAMVSVPSFDPNLFVNGVPLPVYEALNEADSQPLFNRALSGQYPPGSTIKPFLGLAALEAGLRPDHTMVCRGYYMQPKDSRRYRDWKKYGHGEVDLATAITQSCDVFFYDLARNMGIDAMSQYLAHFGFGRRTGIDNVGEAAGILPSREWKRGARGEAWYPGETLITGIGQGYLSATPLQLAVAAATLANGGKRLRPRLLAAVDQPPTGDARAPEVLGEVAVKAQANWLAILQAMRNVVHHERGTAYWANLELAYQAAGKTGTAQVVGIGEDEEYDEENIERKLRDHALYIAFAPIEAPRIALAVVVEHGGGGGSVAAPVARRVLDDFLLRAPSSNTGGGPQRGVAAGQG